MFKTDFKIISSKDKNRIFLLFLLMVLCTFLEMVGIGSIPIFALVIINPADLINLFSKYIDLQFILELDKTDLIFYSSIVLFIIFLIKNIIISFFNYYQASVIKHLKQDFYNKLFRLYINSKYEFHLTNNPANLTKNITSEVGRASNFILNLTMLAKEILVAISIFILLFYVDFKISFFTFILLGIFTYFFYTLTKKGATRRGEIVHYIWGSILKAVNQGLGSIKETKILNKENYLINIFNYNIKILEKFNLQQSFMVSLPKIFLEMIAVLTIVIITILFFYFERDQNEFIPLITLITVSSLRLMPSFNTISSSLNRIRFLFPAYDLISSEILSTKEENDKINIFSEQKLQKSFEFKNSIEVKNLSYSYPRTKKSVIENISLEIPFEKSIGIIGESGAGKSTFIDLLTGLLDPTDGKIIIDGLDLKEIKKNWQRQIGYIPQESYLIDDTIKANIAFGVNTNELNNERLKNSIKLAELDEFIDSLPEKENTLVGDRGTRLSGGQKQRIGIARSLYFNPKILIFDEPTSSLDTGNEDKIMRHIYSLGKKMTIIIISHRENILKECDYIYEFRKGKVFKKIS